MDELEQLAAKGRDPEPDRPTRQGEAALRAYLNVAESLAFAHASRFAPLAVGRRAHFGAGTTRAGRWLCAAP